GTGGPGYTTVDKPPANAKYTVRTIAMAKTQTDPAGTSGSQFFIVLSAAAQSALAGQYAIVGKVVGGMAVVNKIAAVPNSGQPNNTAEQKVYIAKATVSVER